MRGLAFGSLANPYGIDLSVLQVPISPTDLQLTTEVLLYPHLGSSEAWIDGARMDLVEVPLVANRVVVRHGAGRLNAEDHLEVVALN